LFCPKPAPQRHPDSDQRACWGGDCSSSNGECLGTSEGCVVPALPRPPRLTQQASGECAPSGQGYALLSRVLSPNGHSQLCQVLSTQQLSETIQGPSPGAAQPRGTKGAADIGTGCSACRCQHQPNQQAAWHRSPAVPKLPVLLALLHRGSARLAPAGRPSVRSQLLLPGLPQHVRWAVLKTRPPGKGGASGPRPAPPLRLQPRPSSRSPQLCPLPFQGWPQCHLSPLIFPHLQETWRGRSRTPQTCLLELGELGS
jgi:hypothetical protein